MINVFLNVNNIGLYVIQIRRVAYTFPYNSIFFVTATNQNITFFLIVIISTKRPNKFSKNKKQIVFLVKTICFFYLCEKQILVNVYH